MKDQVQKLRNLGISAVTLSDIEEEDVKAVEKGVFSVVYGSPEAFLKIARCREETVNKRRVQGKVVCNCSR